VRMEGSASTFPRMDKLVVIRECEVQMSNKVYIPTGIGTLVILVSETEFRALNFVVVSMIFQPTRMCIKE